MEAPRQNARGIYHLCKIFMRVIGELATALYAGRHPQRLTRHSGRVRERLIVNQRDVALRIAPPDRLETLDLPESAEVDRLALQEDDLVLTSRGALRVAVAGPEHAGAIPGANLIVVRLPAELKPSLLAAYLSDPRIEAMLLDEFAGSVTPGFSVDAIRRLKIELPTREAQEDLDLLVRVTDEYEQALLRAIEIRRTISQELVFRAFGALR